MSDVTDIELGDYVRILRSSSWLKLSQVRVTAATE